MSSMNLSKNSKTNLLISPLLLIVMTSIIPVLPNVYAQATNTTTNTTDSVEADEPETPLEFISVIRSLLNQTLVEYTNENYTGAEELATTAYLDNYEYVEAPLAEIDRPLMETTEIQMREELRKMILDRVPIEELQAQIDEINVNLDKSVELLSNSTS